MDNLGVEVDVAPRQTQDFAAPQAAEDPQDERGVQRARSGRAGI